MSLILNGLQTAGFALRISLLKRVTPVRLISLTSTCREEENEEIVKEKEIDPAKDRRTEIPVETSIRYLKSNGYRESYGNDPVWKHYRRNHKGAIPPAKTRRTCIRAGIISTGNPCPICRDEYLIFDYRNVDLLKQFISPHNGETLSYKKTGICQKQHKKLLISLYKAKDHGTITYDPPIREYDYSEWYDTDKQTGAQ